MVLRDLAEQVADSAGAMEAAFMDVAEELLDALRGGPIPDVRSGEPFSAIRTAGDGVMRVGRSRHDRLRVAQRRQHHAAGRRRHAR